MTEWKALLRASCMDWKLVKEIEGVRSGVGDPGEAGDIGDMGDIGEFTSDPRMLPLRLSNL